MRGLKSLLGTTALIAALAWAPAAKAQVVIGIGIQPVCSYGYYGYAPYSCAPMGFYGPGYFYNGIFLGMGPWGGWGYSHGWGGHRFSGEGGGSYHGGPGAASYRSHAGGGAALHSGGPAHTNAGGTHAVAAQPSAAHAQAAHSNGGGGSHPEASHAPSGGGGGHEGGGGGGHEEGGGHR